MKKIIHCFVILFISISFINAEDAAHSLQNAFVSIGEKTGSAVVTISVVQTINQNIPRTSNDPNFDEFMYRFFGGTPNREFKQKGLGSGFIINKEGYILTNEHVVGAADEIEVRLPDGRNFKAALLGSDPKSDIALIKISGENLPFVTLGNSDSVKPGQWCIALGNPFGNIVNNPKPTITAGIVSAIHRTINAHQEDRMYGDLIQIDAPINQGNSGGPLVNIDGEVIGINSLIFSPSGGNIGIGFAIPINRGKSILNDLISGKEIKHGYIGLWLQDINMDIVKQFGLGSEKTGSLIFKVEKESPAETSGLVSGDIIINVDDQPIQNSNDVTRIVSGKRPGESIDLKIFHKGSEKQVKLVIGERKETGSGLIKKSNRGEKLSEWRGIVVENISDEIAKQLELPSKDGVVVSKVAFGSSAFNARISPGDVIYSIGQISTNNVDDFYKAASKLKKGDVLVQTSRGYVVLFDEKK